MPRPVNHDSLLRLRIGSAERSFLDRLANDRRPRSTVSSLVREAIGNLILAEAEAASAAEERRRTKVATLALVQAEMDRREEARKQTGRAP